MVLIEGSKGRGSKIKQQVTAATSEIEEVSKCLEMERNMAGKNRWDSGVKDVIVQLLNQKSLQEKITDLEGCSHHNNIRIYGIPESVEGTSMLRYVENMIMTELGSSMYLDSDKSLGIERAHRALGLQPPVDAPPCPTVVHFLKFNIKEKNPHTAKKKLIQVQGKRVYFDQDYAEMVQLRRREHGPVKEVLKERRIRF